MYTVVRIKRDEFKRLVASALDDYLRQLYEYNNVAKKFSVYLKPVHIVTKRGSRIYIYIAKYWYRLEKSNGKLKWIYIGTSKPQIQGLPEPPPPLIDKIPIEMDGEYVDVDDTIYEALNRISKSKILDKEDGAH
ncbi:MAG: hypothetical protein DRO12_00445 [Thermoprotei archaeon]|nr:MAG: hypothetical protein DRO12_00445 [Thermoprotei archaeon]